MKIATLIIIGIVGVCPFAQWLETNELRPPSKLLLIPKDDPRGLSRFFVDECLTRGLTNSISIDNLRSWATNTIAIYRHRESAMTKATGSIWSYERVEGKDILTNINPIQFSIPSCRLVKPIPEDDRELIEALADAYVKRLNLSVENPIQEYWNEFHTMTPDPKIPNIKFIRSNKGPIEAIQIAWRFYAIVVGPPYYKHPYFDQKGGIGYTKKFADGIYLDIYYR